MSGTLTVKLSNTEAKADVEAPETKTENFLKVSCHVGGSTNYLIDGLKAVRLETL
jgi:hypothetical protein